MQITMKNGFKALLLLTYGVLILILIINCLNLYINSNKKKGKLEIITNGEDYYYDEIHNIRFPGVDMNGATYYFLPSYIDNEDIIQTSNSIKVYQNNGDLLTSARFGEIQDILVDYGDGELIPWKMCFMKSSNINSAFIYTDPPTEADDISREEYINGSIVIYDSRGETNYSDDKILIKGRGNSSWLPWAKKPMEIKLDKTASLCSLKPSNKWCLLANYYDGTFMANKIAFDLANEIGLEYTTDSDWVDIFLNNEYAGIYLICKEPKISGSSVDITSEEANNSKLFPDAVEYISPYISGYKYPVDLPEEKSGYLIRKDEGDSYEKKKCKFSVNGKTFVVQSPNNASLNQVEYIKDYIESIDAQIHANNEGNIPIDMDSFVKRFLIDEFLFNKDAFSRSYYFYKRPYVDKLFAGPCWDYDDAAGQAKDHEPFLNYSESLFNNDVLPERRHEGDTLDWDMHLYENNNDYYNKMKTVFKNTRSAFEKAVFKRIPEYKNRIKASAEMDNLIWPDTRKTYGKYDDNIRYLQFFLYNRIIHMSEMLEDTTPVPDFSVNTKEDHTVQFIFPDGSINTLTVKDGTQLTRESLPGYDESSYYWDNQLRHSTKYSYFLPIYEDTVYELKTISSE